MKIRTLPLVLATVFLLTTSFTFAQVSTPGCSDYTEYLRWVAQDMPPPSQWSPQVNGVTVQGSLAYVAASGAGLAVYDVTDPSNPGLLGMADTPYSCNDVAVVGDYAYVADWHSPGFCVIEVVDPTNPMVIGTNANVTSGNFLKVAVAKTDTVYVIDTYSGIRVIDVSVPTAPNIAGLIGVPGYPWDLHVEDDYLYVVDDITGLIIYDIAEDALAPEEVGRCELPDYNAAVHVVGDYAYVAANYDGLQIINIFDKENPEVVGVLNSPDFHTHFTGVHVVDDLAYIVCTGGSFAREGLLIVNVKTPSDPYTINSLGMYYHNPVDVFVADDHAYVAAMSKGFFVADVSNYRSPPFFSSFTEADYLTRSVEAEGDFAYVLDGLNGLRVFDITTAPAPTLVGNLDLLGDSQQIVLEGTLAYVADGADGLKVIDISTPSSPGLVGSVSPFGSQYDVAVQGDFAYVASFHMGMDVIDISNPAAPFERSDIDPSSSNAVAVAVEGDYAYLACGFDGLYAIDITNPDLPSEVGHMTFEDHAVNVALARGHAFVSGEEGGVFLVDISDPASMSLVSTLVTPGFVFEVIPDGDLAYIADVEGGLQIADYTDLANPRFLGSLDMPFQRTHDIALVGNQVCVADWESGIHVVPQHCVPTGVPDGDVPPLTTQLTAFPNPFNPQTTIYFSLENPEAARIIVYSADGRPVRLLADRIFPAGESSTIWNGRDDRGRSLPSGTYLVHLETASGGKQRKVTLIK